MGLQREGWGLGEGEMGIQEDKEQEASSQDAKSQAPGDSDSMSCLGRVRKAWFLQGSTVEPSGLLWNKKFQCCLPPHPPTQLSR